MATYIVILESILKGIWAQKVWYFEDLWLLLGMLPLGELVWKRDRGMVRNTVLRLSNAK